MCVLYEQKHAKATEDRTFVFLYCSFFLSGKQGSEGRHVVGTPNFFKWSALFCTIVLTSYKMKFRNSRPFVGVLRELPMLNPSSVWVCSELHMATLTDDHTRAQRETIIWWSSIFFQICSQIESMNSYFFMHREESDICWCFCMELGIEF